MEGAILVKAAIMATLVTIYSTSFFGSLVLVVVSASVTGGFVLGAAIVTARSARDIQRRLEELSEQQQGLATKIIKHKPGKGGRREGDT